METLNLQNLEYCVEGFPEIPRDGEGYKKFLFTREQFTAACSKLSPFDFGENLDQTIQIFRDVDKEITNDKNLDDDDFLSRPDFGVGLEDHGDSQIVYFWAFGNHGSILCHAVWLVDLQVVAESFEVQIPPGKIFGKIDRLLSSIQEGGN